MKKKALWAGVILLGLFIVGVGALWIALDSETVGQALLTQVSESSGLQLHAESIDLGIFSGIELKNVAASGSYSRGDYAVHVRRLIFKHRLAPLLRGDFAVDRVGFEEPQVEVVVRKPEADASAKGAGTAPESPRTAPGWLRLEVREISIAKGTVAVREELPGREPRQTLRLGGVNLILRNIVFDATAANPVDRLAGRGRITIDTAQMGKLPFRDLSGDLGLQKGLLNADRLSVSSDQGDLQADVAADFNPDPFTYRVTVTASPLNVNEMVGLGKDGTLGPGRLQFDGHGQGSSPEGLVGQGILHLDPGKIPGHPILSKVESILGMRGLVGGDYEASDAKFQVADKRVTIEGFSLKTRQASLSLAGDVELDGPLRLLLRLRAKVDELSVPGVPRRVLKTLADGEGWVVIPLKVTGTREDPHVQPDTEALLSQVGSRFMRLLGGSTKAESPLEQLLNP